MSRARDLASIFNLSPLSGTAAERPSTATIGQLYYNGTTAKTQIYTSTGWQDMASGIAYGNNSARPANPVLGTPYFNGEERRLELYTSNGWQNIVSETPGVVSVSGNYFESVGSATLDITGTNFSTGAIASAIGTNGVEVQANSTTVNSIVSITASFSGLSAANEPYDIKITNTSNLFGLLPDALYINQSPVWQTAAGSLGTFNDEVAISVSATALDPESTAIVYSLASGSSLPAGLSLNSSTGAITGTLPAIGTNTTYTFTINASDGNNVVPRAFSITAIYVSTVEYLVVAGGGGGGNATGTNWGSGGGGGAGGFRTGTMTLTRGSNYTVTVGQGGTGAPKGSSANDATPGGNSVFNNITSAGGGIGGSANFDGGAGGSGGGGGYNLRVAGSGNIPSVSPSQGNNGGSNSHTPSAGGGGGAGAVGQNGVSGQAGAGGVGVQSSITGTATYYAGGGGGGYYDGGGAAGQGGSGGGGAGGTTSNSVSNPGNPGTANTGGGGGGGSSAGSLGQSQAGAGGNGGSGVVVIAYPAVESNIATIPGTITYTLDTTSRPGYKIYKFTAGTGTVTF